MGRLIDADAFYRKLNDLSKEHQGAYNGAINDCMNLLEEQPTAYDVERVVETVNDSIRNCDDVSPTECMKMSCYDCKCKRVEKIIRKGGVE